MDTNLFRYIWRHSKRDQLVILAFILASLPFYFAMLDLPRQIVNEAIQGRAFQAGNATTSFLRLGISWPEWLGGGRLSLFEGFQVDRVGLLFGLSAVFLTLVVINGAFKYFINVGKGALGERMLRRMRFDLFNMALRFTPQALREIRSTETATIVKDEVEPIGGFVGEAFIVPVFLGTQAATALLFIMVQNVWLGLMAAGVIAIQFTVIPYLRRELLRLGKQRQIASRQLAGRVGEVVDGMEAVRVHNAGAWERAEIGHRLYELFDLRFRIYKRKFMVKFLNNFLAQITPFLFYAVGGYFALTGRLDIGQLVAAIGAYRELPPPLKELIDWDQARLDVQVKYEQVLQHFSADRLGPPEEAATEAVKDEPLAGPLAIEDLRVADAAGSAVIDGLTLTLPLPSRVAIVSDGGPGATTLARILAGRVQHYAGTVSLGGVELRTLPRAYVGRHVGYAGGDPVLFPGTLRDNLIYGLRHRPLSSPEEGPRELARRIAEARRTGNPFDSIRGRWIDVALAGVADEDELDAALIGLLNEVQMGEDVYRFGLLGRLDPARHGDLAGRLVEAREAVHERLAAGGMGDLVEHFDPERYNAQATVGENLLFGVPTKPALAGRELAAHAPFRTALRADGLDRHLGDLGARIAETMLEIFRGLPHGHPLFDQFSLIGADELGDFQGILRRHRSGTGFPARDLTRLLGLTLAYVEPRHRLGLIGPELQARLVAARARVHDVLGRHPDPGVEFYVPGQVCLSAPIRENLLFGRINHNAPDAQARLTEIITEVVDGLGLRPLVERLGLDYQVGPAGRQLSPAQRAAAALVRVLVKRPDVLVLDGGLTAMGEVQGRQVLGVILKLFGERALFVVLPNSRAAEGFDEAIVFRGAAATREPLSAPPGPVAEEPAEAPRLAPAPA
ncbi:MAG TPA: ABC transporter transmembrane domain-containing protein [Beijerinckiaceae bacterium]|nr:ABC transporter transmembrane domain-containing protein [Beijerinckiaceae bacterium]